MTVQPLFEPFAHKQLLLQNRFVVIPTTRSGSRYGQPAQDVASHYRRRAEYEAGLVLSEGAAIDGAAATHDPHVPHFFGEAALDAWQQLHDSVVRLGGVMAPQLWHLGEMPHDVVGISERAIAATIDAYAQAAQQAQRLGFMAVEVHAADGFLIDQFFWQGTNKRTDRFCGKTVKERSRFAAEVLSAMRRATGNDFTLIMRLSQNRPQAPKARIATTCGEMEQWLTPLVEAGVDILHCAQGNWQTPEFAGSPLNFAGWAKKIANLPVITSGGVGLAPQRHQDLEELVHRLERGDFDLVALDGVLAQNSAWLRDLKHGALEALGPRSPEPVHRVI